MFLPNSNRHYQASTIRTLIVLVSILAIIPTACSPSLKTYRIGGIAFAHEKATLDNGLRVVVQPDDSLAEVLVTIRYDVGFGFDPPDKRGLAHLVEHLAFRRGDVLIDAPTKQRQSQTSTQPTQTKTSDAPAKAATDKAKKKKFRVVDYLLTTSNAWTNLDETYYYYEAPPIHINRLLRRVARQMGDFTGDLSPEVFETEREVVRNERRSRYEGEPLSRWVLDLFETFYPSGHPYHQAGIGTHESISSFTLEDVSAFLEAHYHPSNAILTVVGPVDAQQTMAQIRKSFEDKPKKAPSVQPTPTWEPSYQEKVIVTPKANDTMITVAWPIAPELSKDALAIKFLDYSTGYFHYRLVTNRGWANRVWSSLWGYRAGSMFIVQAVLRDHDDMEAARDKIFDIADAMNGYIRAPWLARSKRRHIRKHLYDSENPRGRARAMTENYRHWNEPMAWNQYFDAVRAIEVSDTRDAGRRLLEKERALVLIHTPIDPKAASTKPRTSSKSAATKQQSVGNGTGDSNLHDNRTTLPAVYRFSQNVKDHQSWAQSSIAHWRDVEEITLSNGIRCRVAQDGQLPIMAVSALLGGGESIEPKDQYGVASLTLSNMDLNGRAYRKQRSTMGIRTDVNSYSEYVTLGQRFLSMYADPGLELFAQQIFEPLFNRRDLMDVITKRKASLASSKSDIDTLTGRAFWRSRGLEKLDPMATQATYDNIGLNSLSSYQEAITYPENLIISVVSDRPVSEIRPLLEKHFGSESTTGREALRPAHLNRDQLNTKMGQIISVPVKGTPQSKIRIAYDASGYLDWKGSLLTSAISTLLRAETKKIREAMGVTYGVGTSTRRFAYHGQISISTKVEREATQEAIRQLLAIIEEVRTTEVSADTFEYLKRKLRNSFAGGSRAAMSQAKHHTRRMFRGRPVTYEQDALNWIEQLTLKEFQAKLVEVLSNPGALIVVGSQPKELKERPDYLRDFSGGFVEYKPEDLL